MPTAQPSGGQPVGDASAALDAQHGGVDIADLRDRSGAAGAGPDAFSASRHAAAAALALGEAPGGDGRFREAEFFLSPVR